MMNLYRIHHGESNDTNIGSIGAVSALYRHIIRFLPIEFIFLLKIVQILHLKVQNPQAQSGNISPTCIGSIGCISGAYWPQLLPKMHFYSGQKLMPIWCRYCADTANIGGYVIRDSYLSNLMQKTPNSRLKFMFSNDITLGNFFNKINK